MIGDPRGRPGQRTAGATAGRALLGAVRARTQVEETTDAAAVAADLELDLDEVRTALEALIGDGLLTGTVVRAWAEGAPLRVTGVSVTAAGRRALEAPTGP